MIFRCVRSRGKVRKVPPTPLHLAVSSPTMHNRLSLSLSSTWTSISKAARGRGGGGGGLEGRPGESRALDLASERLKRSADGLQKKNRPTAKSRGDAQRPQSQATGRDQKYNPALFHAPPPHAAHLNGELASVRSTAMEKRPSTNWPWSLCPTEIVLLQKQRPGIRGERAAEKFSPRRGVNHFFTTQTKTRVGEKVRPSCANKNKLRRGDRRHHVVRTSRAT